MPLPRIETFTGSAGVLDSTWTQQDGGGGTVNYDGSGNAIAGTAGRDVTVFDNANVYGNDHYSEITIASTPDTIAAQKVTTRAAGTGGTERSYRTVINGSGAGVLEMWRVTGGSQTSIQVFSGAPAFSSGDGLRQLSVGSNHSVYRRVAGALVFIATKSDSNHATGSAGFGFYDETGGTVAAISDWEGGNAETMSAVNIPFPRNRLLFPNRPFAGVGSRAQKIGCGNPMREARYYGPPVSAEAPIELLVDNALMALAAENIDLTQANTLAAQDATIALSAESPSLIQANTIAPNDALIALNAESPALTQANTLAANDALIALSAESPSLTQANTLAANDATIALNAENVDLAQANVLAAIDALIALSAESPDLTQANTLQSIDALIALSAETPTLSFETSLAPDDATILLSVESPDLTQANILVVSDALIALTFDNVTLVTGLHLIGVTRDKLTGVPIAGITVHVFRTSDDVEVAQGVSDGSGTYNLEIPAGSGDLYVVAYKVGSPDIFGTTRNDLVAV